MPTDLMFGLTARSAFTTEATCETSLSASIADSRRSITSPSLLTNAVRIFGPERSIPTKVGADPLGLFMGYVFLCTVDVELGEG
jgi:hypothetical protein